MTGMRRMPEEGRVLSDRSPHYGTCGFVRLSLLEETFWNDQYYRELTIGRKNHFGSI
jgi:hypothetical protein